MRKRVIGLFILMAVFLAACGKQPQIVLETTSFDFGDVVNGDIAETDIQVRNAGESDLIVESVSTSCGCTSATLEPMTIAPGESGTLHIELDSGAHGPELTGTLVRQVFLISNDEAQSQAEVEVTVNILAGEK